LGEGAFSEVGPARDGSGGRRQAAVGVGLRGACVELAWSLRGACVEPVPDPERGMRRWLPVRRSTDDPEDLGFYQAYGPEESTVEELVGVVGVCQERWEVEVCFAQAKGEVGLEVGLDHYEVRRWEAWQRHITLCLELASPCLLRGEL
jgi:hypothetical protein